MTSAKMLGISDEVTDCGCCGKANLKSTVAISLDGESDPVYFGRDCAARTLQGMGFSIKPAKVQRIAEAVENSKDAICRYEASAIRLKEMLAAGHTRYVIGGKEIGADLKMLIEHTQQDVERETSRLRKLQMVANEANQC